MNNISVDHLKCFVTDVLIKLGLSEEQSRITAKHMVFADAKGTHTHGVMQLPIYVERIKHGGVNNQPQIFWERETDNSAVLNADNGIGHYVTHMAMERAIELAKKNTISLYEQLKQIVVDLDLEAFRYGL
jgi:LDH2 family malate/lactate/ureidoglycolate dehydrogenase